MKTTTLFTVTATAADFLAKVAKYPATEQDIWLTHALKTINYYRRVMWKTILKYYDQEIGDTEFLDVMIRLIEGQMRRAWNEGMRAVGLDPATDMKPAWGQMIKDAVNSEFNYVLKLGNDIQRTKGLGLSVDKFRSRVELWVNRYTDIMNRAKVECGKEKNQKLRWKFGDTIHCPVCLGLNGIVAYAQLWDDLDVRPQSPPNWALSLKPEGCIGWHCECEFIPTDERVSVRADLKIYNAVWGRGATKGGEGSGYHAPEHRGRPGEVGGSLPSGIVGDDKSKLKVVGEVFDPLDDEHYPVYDLRENMQNIDNLEGGSVIMVCVRGKNTGMILGSEQATIHSLVLREFDKSDTVDNWVRYRMLFSDEGKGLFTYTSTAASILDFRDPDTEIKALETIYEANDILIENGYAAENKLLITLTLSKDKIITTIKMALKDNTYSSKAKKE